MPRMESARGVPQRQGQRKLFPPCKVQKRRGLGERHVGARRVFHGDFLVSIPFRGTGVCVSTTPALTDVDPADPLFHLHSAPLSSSAVLFCLFVFPFGSESSRGDETENFLVVGVLCVCTEFLYLVPVVDDIFPPTLSLSLTHPCRPPFHTHLPGPSISSSCIYFPLGGTLCFLAELFFTHFQSNTFPLSVAPLHPSSPWLLEHLFLVFDFLLLPLPPPPPVRTSPCISLRLTFSTSKHPSKGLSDL